MRERFFKVQRAINILQEHMAYFVCDELKDYYGEDDWWYEVCNVLKFPDKLPNSGSYEMLVGSLEISQLLQLLDRCWNDVFGTILDKECRAWVNELKGVRNLTSHSGINDLDQLVAERHLDTMARLCEFFSAGGAEDIWKLHTEVREMDIKTEIVEVVPEEQDTDIPRDIEIAPTKKEEVNVSKDEDINLISLIGTEAVQKTTLTRKVTFGGKTLAYPVYRVRLDLLKYNDQNDRIATWMSRYAAENGSNVLESKKREDFNIIIEDFVYQSNSDSIHKTQNNIGIFGQREAGVTLSDGRIVDGNRRFTCLRRLQRDTEDVLFFETVIMDVDIQKDRKQIKQLELSIQHGEEKKVEYDLIEYAIGTYRDIVKTKLLTIEEYSASTNEPVSEIKKRIRIAEIICEFLNYYGVPEKYHIARELQVYSLFQEMTSILGKLTDAEKVELKKIAFNNAVLKGQNDQRKFIRDISTLVNSKNYAGFFADQMKISEKIEQSIKEAALKTKEDVDAFAQNNSAFKEELQYSFERALQRHRNQQIKDEPAEKINKSLDLLLNIDSRMFTKLSAEEKTEMLKNVNSVIEMATILKNSLEMD